MFTSRAEFRLQLRIDNADRRLTPHGRRVGLISDEAWADHQAKQVRLEGMKRLLEQTKLTSKMLGGRGRLPLRGSISFPASESSATATINEQQVTKDLSAAIGQPLAQLLKRPEISIEQLAPILRNLAPDFFDSAVPTTNDTLLSSRARNDLKSIETEIKYAGYLSQQQRSIDRLKKAEQRAIPDWFDYRAVSGLSREMQEKLFKIRPRTLGHAARIPGVTPAASESRTKNAEAASDFVRV